MPAPSPRERQRALSALATLSQRDLTAIWRKLDLSHPDKLAEPLAQVLAEIADRYGAAAASLAADWYDEARADAQITGSFTASPVGLPDSDRFDALSRWGVGPLFGANPDGAAALSLLAGGLQRIVLDQARDTTYTAVSNDPVGVRYARYASANACAFCALMATRGAVYTSEENALRVTGQSLGGKDYRKMRRYGSSRSSILAGSKAATIAQGGRARRSTKRDIGEKYHDDCRCIAVEVFEGVGWDEPAYVEKWRDAYAESPLKPTDYKGKQINITDLKTSLSSMRKTLGTN